MINHYSASSLNWTPIGGEYLNLNRKIKDSHSFLSGGFISAPCLSSIKDITINHNTIFYLTDNTTPTDLFGYSDSISLSSLSSSNLSGDFIKSGVTSGCHFVDYFYCNTNNPQLNKTVDIKNIIKIKPNILLTASFRSPLLDIENDNSTISAFKFNFIGLKNFTTPSGDYDPYLLDNARTYNKIFTGTNQKEGLYDVFLGYSSNSRNIKFPPNETTFFYYPIDAEEEELLSASSLLSSGSYPGLSPIESDIIGIDNIGYKKHTFSGGDGLNNGNFLCAWLSGNNDCSCEAIWMERWYDPDTVSMGDAYIQSVNSGCGSIWDIPSSMKLNRGQRYYYDRFGKDRNDIVSKLSDSNLTLEIKNWTEKIFDTFGTYVGYIIPNYDYEPTNLELNGSIHAHIFPQKNILSEDEISVSLNVFKENWCCGKNSQIIGNYHFGGWGLFYNTGVPNNLLTIGDDLGNVFSFNINGTRIFEKDTEKNSKLNNVNIDYIITDLNGARWILDKRNNKILKLDVDDILTEIVNYPKSFIINKIQLNLDNNILFLDEKTHNVFIHDESGNYLYTISAPTSANNFELIKDGSLIFDMCDVLTLNSKGDIYKSFGSNLYKNGRPFLHLNSRVYDIKLDAYDNLYVVHNGNRLMKIDPTENILFDIESFDFLKDETEAYIGLTRKSNKEGCDEDRIWVVYSTNRHIVEYDPKGKITNYKNTSDLITTKTCENYNLKAKGDFTGYDSHRKFELVENKSISPVSPAISLKIKFKNSCGGSLFKYINIPSCLLSNGWHNFGFSYNRNRKKLYLFIDGVVAGEEGFPDSSWKIDYNYITPIIIGGNSGKLGSENEEKSIYESQYFIGKVGDVKIYNKDIGEFQFKSIYNTYFNDFDELSWNIKINSIDLIEKINRFFMFKKPGHKSKNFNIHIKGLDIPNDLKLLIKDSIYNNIKTIIPAHSELNTIVL